MSCTIQALIHGLNRHYYSISINYRKNDLEQKMLWNLHKKSWTEGLSLAEYEQHCKMNEQSVRSMLELAKTYNKVRKFSIDVANIHSNVVLWIRLWKRKKR